MYKTQMILKQIQVWHKTATRYHKN